MGFTAEDKFQMWFVRPYEALLNARNSGPDQPQDGAFIALSVGLFLFERYYRIESGSQEDLHATKMLAHAAEELDLNKDFLTAFWNTYRHGLLHQGSPKSHTFAGREYRWRIDGTYQKLPTEFMKDNCHYICINPWDFLKFALDLYHTKPENLEGIVKYQFGDIFPVATEPSHQQPRFGDVYPLAPSLP